MQDNLIRSPPLEECSPGAMEQGMGGIIRDVTMCECVYSRTGVNSCSGGRVDLHYALEE